MGTTPNHTVQPSNNRTPAPLWIPHSPLRGGRPPPTGQRLPAPITGTAKPPTTPSPLPLTPLEEYHAAPRYVIPSLPGGGPASPRNPTPATISHFRQLHLHHHAIKRPILPGASTTPGTHNPPPLGPPHGAHHSPTQSPHPPTTAGLNHLSPQPTHPPSHHPAPADKAKVRSVCWWSTMIAL